MSCPQSCLTGQGGWGFTLWAVVGPCGFSAFLCLHAGVATQNCLGGSSSSCPALPAGMPRFPSCLAADSGPCPAGCLGQGHSFLTLLTQCPVQGKPESLLACSRGNAPLQPNATETLPRSPSPTPPFCFDVFFGSWA